MNTRRFIIARQRLIKKSKAIAMRKQEKLQRELQGKGYNIVLCNNCEVPIIHTSKERDVYTTCYNCGERINYNECSDLFY